jgi:hypothetical protein
MRIRFVESSAAALALTLFLCAAELRAQAAAPADTFAADLTTTLDAIESGSDLPAGTRIAVACPAGAREATIWGTGTYTSDSAICVAATHAGALSGTDAGTVVVEVAAGLQVYEGTIRHGIASTAYPAWTQSFRFPDAPEADTGDSVYFDHTGDWVTSPNRFPMQSGVVYRFACPAANQTGNVWGTDIYTDDSSICEAAVHAGVIGREGGMVHYERLGAQQSFRGSVRNGVSSLDYAAWPGSFRFVDPEQADAKPAAEN